MPRGECSSPAEYFPQGGDLAEPLIAHSLILLAWLLLDEQAHGRSYCYTSFAVAVKWVSWSYVMLWELPHQYIRHSERPQIVNAGEGTLGRESEPICRVSINSSKNKLLHAGVKRDWYNCRAMKWLAGLTEEWHHIKEWISVSASDSTSR